jgi:hypothetical protein
MHEGGTRPDAPPSAGATTLDGEFKRVPDERLPR